MLIQGMMGICLNMILIKMKFGLDFYSSMYDTVDVLQGFRIDNCDICHVLH